MDTDPPGQFGPAFRAFSSILSILFVTLGAFARNKYKEEAKIGVGPN